MPVSLGNLPLITLGELVRDARAGKAWQPDTSAYFVVVLPKDGRAGHIPTDWESTHQAIRPSAAALSVADTVVVPLRKRPKTGSNHVTVGRSTVCDVVLPFPALSKVHARLTEALPDRWDIEDEGSKNGTTLNGNPLVPKHRVALQDGAELTLAGINTTFWLKASLLAEIARLSTLP